MNLEQIKRELIRRAEELARFLFPDGKRVGNHWCIGSIEGGPGQSFKICLSGGRAGFWGDFAGSKKHHSSLVDLWMEKRGVDFNTALVQCADWLGVGEPVRPCKFEKKPATVRPFNWRRCIEAFTDKDIERVAKWRGYSPNFCLWLRDQNLLGISSGHIAFPVHDDDGHVAGCHYRTKDGGWFYTKGCVAGPLVIGNLADAKQVHCFESQWDAFAICDKLHLHDTAGVAVIITRGAGNGHFVGGLIPPAAQVFAWKQNDEEKHGKRAGDEWLTRVAQSTDAMIHCVATPSAFKDPNAWTHSGAATSEELIDAIKTAERIELTPTANQPNPSSLNSLISPVRTLGLEDDFPQPLARAALHGIAGEIVRRIEPHTEADPAALLLQVLTAVGNLVGRDPYIVADGAHHHLNLYVVLVGESSRGRKGTSWSQVKRLLLRLDEPWLKNCVLNGLSSGEGLIWAVRDPIDQKKPVKEKGGRHTGEYETVTIDEGVDDKRCFVVESEFANVLKVMTREGNTLSSVMRSAWDTGDLRTMTKNSPARATGAHVSIVGHITRAELRRQLTQTESANGFANRILWVAVKRSKYLPEGGQIDSVDFTDVLTHLADVKDLAWTVGEMKRDEDARALWKECYVSLSDGKPGMWGAVTGRAEAQVTRLSALYAILDKSKVIRAEHHHAAMAVWDYCLQSARWAFDTGTGDRNADKILRALRHAENGLTRTEISSEVFNRHKATAQIDEALRLLHGLKMVTYRMEPTDGAPVQRWFYSVESAK